MSEVKWIELLSNQVAEVEAVGRQLGVHPLAIEDCLKSNQRAKFEEYEAHQLLVWFLVRHGRVYELEFVIFPDTVLLVVNRPAPEGQSWKEFLKVQNQASSANHLVYQALDHATDMSEEYLRPLFAEIGHFADRLFSAQADPHELLRLRHKLAHAEFALAYLSSVVGQWQRFLNPRDDLRWRMRDLWDHCERVYQGLIFHQSQIASTMDMYWGITAKRTNEQMKKLTILAAVAVPLTVWASFWGMNFRVLPFDKEWAFWAALAGMLLSVVAVYYLLRAKGYFRKD